MALQKQQPNIVDLVCRYAYLGSVDLWGRKRFDLSFFFSNPSLEIAKIGDRRRTLRRQTPNSSPYYLIMNPAKFLPQILFASIDQFQNFLHRCASNSRRVLLIFLSPLRICVHSMQHFRTHSAHLSTRRLQSLFRNAAVS